MGILGGESAASGASSASSSSSAGNSSAAGAQTNSSAGSSASTSAAGSSSGGSPTWRDTLPDDMKANPLLAQFSDVGNLAKSYINAQEMIGKKGVIPPGEKATDEQRAQFYKDLGMPELDKYTLTPPQGTTLNPEFEKGFKENAFKNGIMPKQAESILNWYVEVERSHQKTQADAKVQTEQAGLQGLRTEWGQAYDKQIALGDMALRELGGDAVIAHAVKTGLVKDPVFIKLMAKVGGVMGEDKLRGEDFRKFGGESPKDIQGKIDAIMGDPLSPYFDQTHPGHKATVTKMEDLYKKLHG